MAKTFYIRKGDNVIQFKVRGHYFCFKFLDKDTTRFFNLLGRLASDPGCPISPMDAESLRQASKALARKKREVLAAQEAEERRKCQEELEQAYLKFPPYSKIDLKKPRFKY